MNKQELIEKIKANGEWFETNRYVKITKVIELVNQIDEPQKVKVPKCVGELLDYYRNSTDVDLLALLITFKDWYCRKDKAGENENAIDWLVKHPEKYMRAWLDGYEVEEEPKYSVMVAGKYLIKMFHGRKDHKFVNEAELESWHSSAYKLTQKEIKEIDERYWTFAVPVEKV